MVIVNGDKAYHSYVEQTEVTNIDDSSCKKVIMWRKFYQVQEHFEYKTFPKYSVYCFKFLEYTTKASL